MEIKTPYKVKCSSCGSENLIAMELECTGSYERTMGLELEHLATFDDCCSSCGNPIAVQIDLLEYPEGTVDDFTVRLVGVEEIEKPVFIQEI